jgi:sarcosine oxidase, subunit delta
MLLIPCPYCGPRPELEFRYAGEAHLARAEDPSLLDDDAWTAYLYVRSNPKGPHAERWHHVHGCNRFFNALRDTTNDAFAATYPIGTAKPSLPQPDGKTGAS